MMAGEYNKDFAPQYAEQQKRADWSFKEEMAKCCRSDAEVLGKAVLQFRKMFEDNLETDPLCNATLASLCMAVFLHKLMPPKTIVGNTTTKKDSTVAREWLTHISIEGLKREPKVPIGDFKRRRAKAPQGAEGREAGI